MCQISLYSIFILCNIFLTISSLGLMVISTFTSYSSFDDALPENVESLAKSSTYTLAIGIIICISTVLGFFGARTQARTILIIYIIVLSIIIICQLALSWWTCSKINNSGLESAVSNSFEKIFSNYKENQDIVDLIQNEFECCGVNGTDYWLTNDIPNSCCAVFQSGPSNCGEYQTAACPESFFQNFHWWIQALGYVGFMAFTLEVILWIVLVGYVWNDFPTNEKTENEYRLLRSLNFFKKSSGRSYTE